MRTKGEIVANALSLLSINVSTEPPTHDDIAQGVGVLESMLRDWLQKNINLGYSFSSDPDYLELNNLNPANYETVYYNLAVNLAPHFKRPVPRSVSMLTQASMAATLAKLSQTQQKEIQYPSRQPLGIYLTRHNRLYSNFFPASEQNTEQNQRRQYEFRMRVGERLPRSEDLSWLTENNDKISSYSVTSSEGLTISNISVYYSELIYHVEADEAGAQSVYIRIATNQGRIRTIVRAVEVSPRLTGLQPGGVVTNAN